MITIITKYGFTVTGKLIHWDPRSFWRMVESEGRIFSGYEVCLLEDREHHKLKDYADTLLGVG